MKTAILFTALLAFSVPASAQTTDPNTTTNAPNTNMNTDNDRQGFDLGWLGLLGLAGLAGLLRNKDEYRNQSPKNTATTARI